MELLLYKLYWGNKPKETWVIKKNKGDFNLIDQEKKDGQQQGAGMDKSFSGVESFIKSAASFLKKSVLFNFSISNSYS